MQTTRRGALFGLVAGLGLLLWGPLASAHRLGIPVTTFEWHEPDQVWHVIHRLSSHDFAPEIDGLNVSALEDPEEQALLGRFVIEHFSMSGQTDAIEISYLGAEEETDSFYVYFQVSTPDQTIAIQNNLSLTGESDDRRHALVNVTNGKSTSTLLFTAEDSVKLLELARPEAP